MSIRKELPDTIPGGSDTSALSPAELVDYLPGAATGNFPPGAITQPEDIAADLAHPLQVVNELQDTLAADTLATANPLFDAVEQIQANLIGGAANDIDDINKLVDKLAGKLHSQAVHSMYDVYGKIQDLGFPLPTPEQIATGIATGDYLGSLMTNPTTDTLPVAPPFVPITPNNPTLPLQQPDMPTQPHCPPGFIALPDGSCLDRFNNSSGGTLTQNPVTGEIGIAFCPVGTTFVPPGTLGLDSHQYPYGRCVASSSTGFDTTTPRCGYSGDYDIPPTRYSDGADISGGMMTGHDVYIQLAGGEPPMRQAHWRLSLQGSAGQSPISYEFYAPDGAIVGSYGRRIVYSNAIAGGLGALTCLEKLGTVEDGSSGQTTTGATCPIPPKLDCGVPGFQAPVLGIANDGTCISFEKMLEKLTSTVVDFGQFLSVGTEKIELGSVAKTVVSAVLGSESPILPSIVKRLGEWIKKTAEASAKEAACDPVKLVPVAINAALWKFIGQWFGIVPQALTATLQQAENLTCQYALPDQQSVDSAYLAGEIDKELFDCWTKINGNILQAAEKGIDTRRERPTAQQVSQLFRKGYLSQDQFDKRMRERGVMRAEDKEAIHNLTVDWPSLSDLTPMLVRDVWDETTIDWTQADALFNDKYAGNAKKYFDAIGVTRDVAKYYWRAHFHLPSYTMATEMIHRYRNLDPNDPLYMDVEKMKKLLIQDDWSPEWIDRMIGISFKTLTRVDTRRSYELRTITDDELKDQLRFIGYDDRAVDLMFKYWKRQRELRDIKAGGYPTVKALVTQYANCEINHDQFTFILRKIAENQDQYDNAIDAAENARTTESNKRTIAGVRWQFTRGLITEGEATAQLASNGIDPTCVPSIVKLMKQRQQKQPKQLTAGKLCDMREYGIISSDEMINALIRTGWSPIDAARITNECSARLTDKAMRKAQAEANRIAREAKAAAKEEAKRLRDSECGPAPCPANRQIPSTNGAAGQ